VVLCTCCTCVIGVHVVLGACLRCCVVYMQYHVYELCSRGIMTCVFIVMYIVYVYVLCCTSGVSECIVWWCTPNVGIWVVLHYTVGVGVCVVCQV